MGVDDGAVYLVEDKIVRSERASASEHIVMIFYFRKQSESIEKRQKAINILYFFYSFRFLFEG